MSIYLAAAIEIGHGRDMSNNNTATTKSYTVVDAIREMLAVWTMIESTAKAQYPGATPEKIYQLTSGAFLTQLGMEAR